MDLRKLKTLIELVESSGIAELEIEEGEERVRITRAVARESGVHRRPAGDACPAAASLPVLRSRRPAAAPPSKRRAIR